MESIDIRVTDQTLASEGKNRLLMALPRKVYTQASDTSPNVDTSVNESSEGADDGDGTSYLYPGVSDLEYKQGSWSLGYEFEQRKIVFPSDYYNAITGLSNITFRPTTDGTFPAGAGGSTLGGDQTIQDVGMMVFDTDFQPTGPTGTQSGLNGVGPLIHGVKNITVGNWTGLGFDGSNTNYDGNSSTYGYVVALSNTLHEDGAGIRIKQTDDTGKSGIFLMAKENGHIWSINVLYNSSATSHRVYFRRFSGPTDTSPTNEAYILSLIHI